MFTIYKIFSYLISPILPLFLVIREKKGKEDPLRKREKLGYYTVNRPKGKLLWIHCASVGESNSALALIDRILKDEKIKVLMTTGTLSSAKLMAKKLPKGAIHQFVPLDVPAVVNRFLNYWKPDSVIWTESEIWPNILIQLKQRNIPVASINATISDKSFNSWKKHPKMIKDILSSFSVILAQTNKKVRMLRELGGKNVKNVGNLKFTTNAPEVNNEKLAELKKSLRGRKVVCFSSTHKGEEQMAINIHKNLSKKFKNLITIILPRHPNRRDEIKSLLDRAELNYSLRSEGELPSKGKDIYVADTFGEVGTFYSISPIVFMGGSLSPYHDGGHNPIEPAKFGCAVLSGTKISAFETIFDSLKKATKIVKDEKALERAILSLLKDDSKRKILSKEATKVVGKDNTIIEDILKEIKKAGVL
ncbi:MAG: 3-deoxy-D-manno-octulosonic acid transferase [Alphaproteobacteria bacterium]|jgi:3-deoxy-D-manno-octulosonic-acid transferase|nr:3-deoxy-D-manno-octulosonic acid transferase [Alphaproteobacteria bacterium]